MSARILVVDDLAPNRHLLEVKLTAEYYEVISAASGEDALKIAATEKIDLVLLDAMMPGLSGFEVCEMMKNNAQTWHIPIVMVTALDETTDRIRGLECGADDFISKPIDDFHMLTRVRALLRLKMVTDQLLSHTGQSIEDSRPMLEAMERSNGNILIVDSTELKMERIAKSLRSKHNVTLQMDPKAALADAVRNKDLIIVSLLSPTFDGLRLCASLKANEATRDIPILAIADPMDEARLVRAYELGVNDTLIPPILTPELIARVSTQLKRKFYSDTLRDSFNESLEMVVTDTLTGLGNRRYFDKSVLPMIDEAQMGTAFSMVLFDVDHFKRVNDILGHDVGDLVLQEIAARLASNFRAIDVVARYGGEEFVVAMPNTIANEAYIGADRIRALISGTPISLDGQALSVSISAGVATSEPGESARSIFKRADQALYQAKKLGRNCVVISNMKKAA